MVDYTSWIILLLLLAVVGLLIVVSNRQLRMDGRNEEQANQVKNINEQQTQSREAQINTLGEMQGKLEKRLGELQLNMEKRLGEMSQIQVEKISGSHDKIQETLHKRLNEISGQVEKRLDKGFEKTNETFTDVVKRLALIDEAQKKITELSSNVVSLQEILSDKSSRGAYGEVQLNALIRNTLPESSFALQHTLTNGARVDCMLFLPEPSGHIAIDSKFPLDSYQSMLDTARTEADRAVSEKQFKVDIKKHISDISDKYIIPGQTSDGAMMFIPAEAVFAEIHAHHPELVEYAHRKKVWMVSPTTFMAVLTTARAVLKDFATRKQIHIIQEHLVSLSKDFDRFRKRMDNLAKHISQANKDVEDVHTSARKISNRFEKIEQVELKEDDDIELLEDETNNEINEA